MTNQLANHCTLGNDDHDKAHERLFDRADEIINLVRMQQPHAEQVVALRQMLADHFAHENKHLVEIQCPSSASHMRDHAMLLDHLDKIMHQKEIGASLAYSVTVLENLFADHIQHYDRMMVMHERSVE